MSADKRAQRHIAERVERGIQLLNRKVGPEWVEYIKIGGLDMANGNACIVGQAGPKILDVLGANGFIPEINFAVDPALPTLSYQESCERLGLKSINAQVSHGFQRSWAERHSYDFGDLQREWERRLSLLQRKAGVS